MFRSFVESDIITISSKRLYRAHRRYRTPRRHVLQISRPIQDDFSTQTHYSSILIPGFRAHTLKVFLFGYSSIFFLFIYFFSVVRHPIFRPRSLGTFDIVFSYNFYHLVSRLSIRPNQSVRPSTRATIAINIITTHEYVTRTFRQHTYTRVVPSINIIRYRCTRPLYTVRLLTLYPV